MILPDEQVIEIAKEMARKTKANQMVWKSAGSTFYVSLPGVTIAISRDNDIYYLRVLSNINDVLGAVTIDKEAPTFNLIRDFYAGIETYMANRLVGSILAELKKPGTVGELYGTVTSGGVYSSLTGFAPDYPPPIPTQIQIADFFQKIKGDWSLDYSRGTEEIVIDGEGNYFLKGESTPAFRLSLLACNPEMTTVEIGKDKRNGRRKQIESLEIKADFSQMIGIAKHDQHSLKYTRR